MADREDRTRPRRWYERSWVIVLVCLAALGISVSSVLDLMGDDPQWVRSVVFTLFGPAAVLLGWDTWRKRPSS
ncbi:hypothetical protein [Desertihabitans aurantiacus]|uniref:hypothetical protein n=1 Tax=Desertihabitans aurantiacus TaxID=2282477 RepID=UPI00130087AD|nr:hypothetical protein [Desertihabitans aurantiacus]